VIVPDSPTKQTLRMCSIHKVVEVLPGIWKLDRFLTRFRSNNYEIEEVECLICLQLTREAFKKQFPTLYTTPQSVQQSTYREWGEDMPGMYEDKAILQEGIWR
jgi:hypothetical protein